jgi:hypothetical protein
MRSAGGQFAGCALFIKALFAAALVRQGATFRVKGRVLKVISVQVA